MCRKIFSAILSMFLSTTFAFPCTMGGPILKKFDKQEYVFIGIVEGYVDDVKPRKLTDERMGKGLVSSAAGVVVKPKQIVFIPQARAESYEIFDFILYADCSQGGMKLSDVSRRFPIGSEVRVIAREAVFLPVSPAKDVVRLEIIPAGLGSISTNVDQNGKAVTSASSVFDYRTYNAISDSLGNYSLPDFELRKDLLRLERTEDQRERNKILDRIVLAPVSARFSFDLSEIFRLFTATDLEYQRYIDALLKKEMTEEQFREYKAKQESVKKPSSFQ